MDNQLGAIFAP